MNNRWRAARAAFLTAVLSAAAALIFTGAAAAMPYLGDYSNVRLADADPPLTLLASVPLTTPGGTIQSVVYDGANTAVNALGLGGGLSQFSRRAPVEGRHNFMYLLTAHWTISAGTSEIQRNIIAQRGLGLPKG